MNSKNQLNVNVIKFVDFETFRIEELIKQREIYEDAFFSEKDILKSEEINFTITRYENDIGLSPSQFEDLQIESLEFFDEDDYFYDDYLQECPYFEPFDCLDGFDYPEGPDENLNGIKYF